jgi:hypothetical protein
LHIRVFAAGGGGSVTRQESKERIEREREREKQREKERKERKRERERERERERQVLYHNSLLKKKIVKDQGGNRKRQRLIAVQLDSYCNEKSCY